MVLVRDERWKGREGKKQKVTMLKFVVAVLCGVVVAGRRSWTRSPGGVLFGVTRTKAWAAKSKVLGNETRVPGAGRPEEKGARREALANETMAIRRCGSGRFVLRRQM